MTKKDFELIAGIISELYLGDDEDSAYDTRNSIAEQFARELKVADVNPNFDEQRFLSACQPK